MKLPRIQSTFVSFAMPILAGLLLLASATFAADELCASCVPQVNVNGSFTHRKDGPAVAIEGAPGIVGFTIYD